MKTITSRPTKRPATWKILVFSLVSVVVLGIVIFISYFLYSAGNSLPVDTTTYQTAIDGQNVKFSDQGEYYSIQPVTTATAGLIIYPGAFADPRAYVAAYSELVEANIAIFVIKSPLNFALLNTGQSNKIMSDNSELTNWFVAGHSLGGVAACEYSKQNEDSINGLILLASYCNGDASTLNIPVLSISASNDGLSTPDKINSSRNKLPNNTEFVIIEGANHTQFGVFSKTQPGDNASSINQNDALDQINNEIIEFIQKYSD